MGKISKKDMRRLLDNEVANDLVVAATEFNQLVDSIEESQGELGNPCASRFLLKQLRVHERKLWALCADFCRENVSRLEKE